MTWAHREAEAVRALLVKQSSEIDRMVTATVLPHRCYENAYAFITANLNAGWLLVHGIAVGQGGEAKGHRFGHAWVENRTGPVAVVYDPTKDKLLPAPLYYHAGGIDYTVAYDDYTALAIAVRHGSPGPWDPTIRGARHRNDDDR